MDRCLVHVALHLADEVLMAGDDLVRPLPKPQMPGEKMAIIPEKKSLVRYAVAYASMVFFDLCLLLRLKESWPPAIGAVYPFFFLICTIDTGSCA
jgi:hypothetical protein